MKLTFHTITIHRNGICGAPFHAMLFDDPNEGRMLGIVFEQEHHVAVFNLEQLALGNIAFGVNSWRGDHYEPHLRPAIVRYGLQADDAPLPPDPDQKNDERADWARTALAAFIQATGVDREDSLGDLLGDLMHWSDRNSFDFDAALDRGRGHYEAETSARAGGL